MLKINQLIKKIYDYSNIYMIKSEDVNYKIEDDHLTYHIITDDVPDFDLEKREVREDGVYRIYQRNYQGSISFNSISKNQNNAFNNIQTIKDLLEYEIKEEIYNDLDIVILNVGDIKDVSLRLPEIKEYRYNTDITFRASRVIEREVEQIEEVEINGFKFLK